MAPDRGPVLLAVARGAIARQLGEPSATLESAAWLDEPGATFVTLRLQGELRGCVGSLEATRSVRDDLAANACAAAFRDARFPPLTRKEFRRCEVEVSLLSALERLTFTSQEHLLAQLRPGVDGLVLEWGWKRGTFLPQVWDEVPDPATFLAHLKLKAGLPAEFWSNDLVFYRYTVSRWREHKVLEGAAHA
jgi:hypothetical protein